MKNATYREGPGLGEDSSDPKKAWDAAHASPGGPWKGAPGLRGAGTAQRNVLPSRSRRRSMKKSSFTN
jgi:hypothetical protein